MFASASDRYGLSRGTFATDDFDAGIATSQRPDAVQLIAFSVEDQVYAVEITSVREIRAWSGATPLPNTADFVRGVINLRGAIVPIIDLRARFGSGRTNATKTHVVIVLMIGSRLAGILVDAVYDILSVIGEDVQNVPGGDEGEGELLQGLVSYNDRMVGIVRLDRIFAGAVNG